MLTKSGIMPRIRFGGSPGSAGCRLTEPSATEFGGLETPGMELAAGEEVWLGLQVAFAFASDGEHCSCSGLFCFSD